MDAHSLGLDIVDTSNQNILKVSDISVYNSDLGVTCQELLITPPGFQVSTTVPITFLQQGFNLVLTACDLGLQQAYCDSKFDPLPDGIYALRYSIAPNDYVYVEYNHLRTVEALNRLDKLFCQLDLGDCTPTRDKLDRLAKLMEIKGMLHAAKTTVEYCHRSDKGMVIYDQAVKMLEKLDCKTCG